jgi:diacylglycerol kinase (ATP)
VAGPGRRPASGHTRLGPQPTAEHYAFTTLKPIPLQLDGELLALDAGTPMRIDIAPAALATLG